jgi:SAM-dependent methyltransferase
VRSSFLLEKALELEYLLEDISNHISNDENFAMIDFNSARLCADQLRSVAKLQNKNLNEGFRKLSKKMSPDVLDEDQFDSFYQHINFDEYQLEFLKGKFSNLISFEFPVLELFPGQGQFTESAVSAEPLYIADYYMKTLDKIANKFNEFYREKRLIRKEIRDFDLSILPQNQFGLVFSFNLFVVKDEEFISNWAKEVFKILRPGGHYVFNFIPDDTPEGLRLVEDYLLAAIDHNQLEQDLISYGYEIVQKDYKTRANNSTFTIKKPGVIKPLKLTGSIARIIDKSEPFV